MVGFNLPKTVQVTKEKEKLIGFFKQLDMQTLTGVAEAISMMVRAFEGKPIEKDDIITRLINVKKIWERSRFPTYPLLRKQVYLRLLKWKYGDMAEACEVWADFEAEALISYKGEGRAEYVELGKAVSGVTGQEQQFYLGSQQQRQEQKRGLMSRLRKPKEQTEFQSK